MGTNLTELVFILDRSGSMSGLERDTIGGFNGMIKRQKSEKGDVLVSTVLFDDINEVLYNRVPIERIRPMTEDMYYVRGCTALLDAVGDAIHHIGNVHKYARPEERPQHTIFVITTDGYENASRKYSYDKIRCMVERQKCRYNWEFLFFGANIDAVAEAEKFGITEDRATNYVPDEKGTILNYKAMNKAVTMMRKKSSDRDIVGAEWKVEIEADFTRRGRKHRNRL